MNSKKIMPSSLFANSKIVKIITRIPEITSKGLRYRFKVTILPIVLLALPGLVVNAHSPGQEVNGESQLERIRRSGELVLAIQGPAPTDSDTAVLQESLDFELAQRFASRLGVKLRYIQGNSRHDLIRMLTNHEADFIATAIPITEERRRTLRFSPAFRQITEKVVFRAEAGQETQNGAVFRDVPVTAKDWVLGSESYDLKNRLRMVNDGLLDYTVVPSDQIARMQRYFPNIEVAFEQGEPQDLGWAFSQSEDNSLYNEVSSFFDAIRQDGTLARLTKKHDAVWMATDASVDAALRSHVRQRLPRYRALFQNAGRKFDIDWRLLAAIAYQESQWDAHAVSAEGVQGMMMLTGNTARELNVTDRFNVSQSIHGGAEYLHEILEGLPSPVHGQDRIWLALAAYNIGYNHIERARKIAGRQGRDPNAWESVKAVLPQMGGKAAASPRERARGHLTVHYVENICRHYDLLVWLTDEKQTTAAGSAASRARPDVNKGRALEGGA
ncbi:membrane-bound lytic murein transglycosylase MltF [Candidatus Methylospira mobilis]|nr:membrane-bound lytic murein transglycosylase MltF [Candidatus Methylospira mobilis]